MTQVDYTERAITMRLKRLAQLRRLCVSLKKAGEALPTTPDRLPPSKP
jgi:hypothetical protein